MEGDTTGPSSASTSELENYFRARGISFRPSPIRTIPDPSLDRLAAFLGDHYSLCRRVYKPVKRHRVAPNPFWVDLKEADGAELAATQQFCHLAKEAGLLARWKYYKAPQCRLLVGPLCTPRFSHFISGNWLERFLHRRVRELAGPSARYEGWPNLEIRLANGGAYELDLVATAHGEVFWFEAKLQAHRRDLEKYARLQRVFGLDTAHSLVVVADATPADCDYLSRRHGLSVFSLTDLESVLTPLIGPSFLEQRLPG